MKRKIFKVRCNQCQRQVTDDSHEMALHVLKYHPEIPFLRFASLFTPMALEEIGKHIGNIFLKKVTNG